MARVHMTLEQAAAVADHDQAKIDATTEEDIRRHMIEDGEDPDAPLPCGKVVLAPAEIRRRSGPLATWRNWEQGRKSPDPAARSMLALVADDPARAFRVLAR